MRRTGEITATRLKHASALAIAWTSAVAVVAALSTCVGTSTAASIQPPRWALHGKYSPSIDPANFVATIDNRYFPLKPGTSFHYQGFKGGSRRRTTWT
jgi:hypothetical protein